MDIIEIQKIIRNYYEHLYTKKMDNPEEMDKFLERLNKKEIQKLNRPVTSTVIETVIKNLNKNPAPDGLTGKFIRKFKDLTPILLKQFQKIAGEHSLTHSIRPPSP